MNKKELHELEKYHAMMLHCAQTHVAHHKKMIDHYKKRQQDLKAQNDKVITEKVCKDILEKFSEQKSQQ